MDMPFLLIAIVWLIVPIPDELVISGAIAEYNQTRDTRVVDRSNTGQEVKAIRGTDSILLVQIC